MRIKQTNDPDIIYLFLVLSFLAAIFTMHPAAWFIFILNLFFLILPYIKAYAEHQSTYKESPKYPSSKKLVRTNKKDSNYYLKDYNGEIIIKGLTYSEAMDSEMYLRQGLNKDQIIDRINESRTRNQHIRY